MPLLIGALALGIDTFQIALHNRELQWAADSAALAGAFAALTSEDVRPAAQDSLDKNPHAPLTQPAKVVLEPWGQFDRTVRVEIAAKPVLPFMEFFTGKSGDIVVSSRAALAGTRALLHAFRSMTGATRGCSSRAPMIPPSIAA